MSAPLTFLDLIKGTDNVPYPEEPSYEKVFSGSYTFLSHDGVQIGLLPSNAVAVLKRVFPSKHLVYTDDGTVRTVAIAKALDTFEKRNEAFAEIGQTLRDGGHFRPVLSGWRNELYVIYNPTKVPYFLMERALSPIFGVITYGVHINGYALPNVPAPKGYDSSNNDKLRMWVSKRSATKQTFPGMLDNLVAGGMGYPYGIFESAVKECFEEAGIQEDYAKSHLKPAGVLTYWYQRDYTPKSKESEGEESYTLFQPECEFIYDIEIDESIVPHPVDGEVECFQLLTVPQLVVELAAGKFKPNTAMVAIDYLIRVGEIDAQGEKDYAEILQRCHRRFAYPSM